MNRSWTIATIRGIPIRVHITHLILLVFIAYDISSHFRSYYQGVAELIGLAPQPLLLSPVVWGIAVALVFSCCVVLHELAHCLVARQSGIRVESITLMGLGGVSRMRMEFMPPGREAWMAAAGPLMSLTIGIVVLGATLAIPSHPGDVTAAGLLIAQINIVLAIFNLLPAFPMDGGRVLRAALTPRMGRLRATRRAAFIGRIMAAIFAIVGIITVNPILVLIGVFIVIGASAETAMIETKTLLSGRRIGAFADPRIGDVTPETPLEEVTERFLEDNLVAVRVGDGLSGPGAGYITLADLKRSRRSRGSPLRLAGDVARRDIPRVWASSDAAAAAAALQERGQDAAVVLEDTGKPIGIVTRTDIARMATLADALEQTRGPEEAVP